MSLAPVSKKIVAFGSKQVFLPKFTVALIRTPNASPYTAKFRVPLNFSKYDLRDYLYHAYNVKVHSIRSLVKQLPVRDTARQPRHWFRPESEKYMTVEMEKPFVWPEDPESWEAWGKKEREESIASSMIHQGVLSPDDQRANAKTLRQQALKLLTKDVETDASEETASESPKLVSKPKKIREDVMKRWEEQRTPQVLNHELLGPKNFSSIKHVPANPPRQ